MAVKPIVILHGWSDSSASFERLARRLSRATGRPIEQLWLGDYVSLDDEVRMADVVAGLERAWSALGLPRSANAVDAIVHSTGALVVREWMQQCYMALGERPPLQNLVMLAPANFGSPLAHKGRSIIGRVFKGSGDKPLQTGIHLLRALEMASPFTWKLAERDRFASNAFSAGGVRATVLMGNKGYPGIRGLVNEDGSDGTVYLSTANLNCASIKVQVARDNGKMTAGPVALARGRVAFRLLDGFDHGEITGDDSLPSRLLDPIVKALEVRQAGYAAWCDDCDKVTAEAMAKYERRSATDQHGFQNTVFRVIDDQGRDVPDYAVEFYGEFGDDKDRWARVFNREISGKTHPYGDKPAYRSFRINVTRLYRELERNSQPLKISLSAQPDVTDERNLVGYRTMGEDDIGQLILSSDQVREFFRANRTLFVEIVLPRHQRDKVFSLRQAD